MKKHWLFTTLLAIALCVICFTLFPTEAKAASVDDLTFTLNSDGKGYTVSGYNEYASGVLIIPSYYNGKMVTAIEDGAFEFFENLTSITIPDSVTSIGDSAFKYCSNLISVTIGNNVTSIGDYAFMGCGIGSIIIPDRATSIGDNAFYDCDSLTSVTIPGRLTKRNTFPFENSLESITITNGDIYDKAFSEFYALTSVTICDAVTSIGDSAFEYCDNLSSVIIGESVSTIGDYAFYYCESLTSITIPDSVTSIGYSAFEYCDNLSSVIIGESVSTIGDYAFYYCEDLTSITIPDSVISIGCSAFEDCYNLSSVIIGDSVTSIGDDAFCHCEDLTSITITESVVTIGDAAFFSSGLEDITFLGWDISIGRGAFSGCIYLSDVYYAGTLDQLEAICDASNELLLNANLHLLLKTPIAKISNATNGVKITWNAISDAKNYKVYKSVYSGGKWSSWKAIKTVIGTTYTDTSVKSGDNVKYTVRAFNDNSSSEFVASNSIKYIATPNVTVANAANGVKISWNKISGAKNYTVYKSVYSGGKWSGWKEIKTGVTGTSYTDTSVKSNDNVRYTVKAINGSFKSNVKASSSIKFLAAPTVKVSNATNGVKITWNAISGTKTYTVYKSVYSGGKWSGWKAIKTGVTGTTYTDTSVKSNDNVKYTVRAFNGNFSSTFKSSSSIKFLATPTVKAANAAKGVTVTWNKVAGAKTYTVYRAVYSGGKWSGWTAIKTGVTGTSYTDTTVKSGATVRYTVKAINGNFRSNVKTGNTAKFLAQPAVKVAKATNGIKSTWGKVTGATGYIVYRRTYTNGKWSGWTAIKTTTALSFTDTTAKKGVTYQYTVRAYSGDYKSSYTNSTSIKR